MESITLLKRHVTILKDPQLIDEFIAGIISIFQGKEAQASCSYMETVFNLLVHGQRPKIIVGIPEFNSAGMKKSELERYNQVQAGKVPATGLDHSYTDLQFKPITTLEKEYLSKLYDDCLSRIKSKQCTAEYRRFISYLAEVMKHCANSGEL